jgi:hypothetical protein
MVMFSSLPSQSKIGTGHTSNTAIMLSPIPIPILSNYKPLNLHTPRQLAEGVHVNRREWANRFTDLGWESLS